MNERSRACSWLMVRSKLQQPDHLKMSGQAADCRLEVFENSRIRTRPANPQAGRRKPDVNPVKLCRRTRTGRVRAALATSRPGYKAWRRVSSACSDGILYFDSVLS